MTTIANKTQGYDLAGNVTLAYSADRGTSYNSSSSGCLARPFRESATWR